MTISRFTPFVCHLLHALLLILPRPLNVKTFILGDRKKLVDDSIPGKTLPKKKHPAKKQGKSQSSMWTISVVPFWKWHKNRV